MSMESNNRGLFKKLRSKTKHKKKLNKLVEQMCEVAKMPTPSESREGKV